MNVTAVSYPSSLCFSVSKCPEISSMRESQSQWDTKASELAGAQPPPARPAQPAIGIALNSASVIPQQVTPASLYWRSTPKWLSAIEAGLLWQWPQLKPILFYAVTEVCCHMPTITTTTTANTDINKNNFSKRKQTNTKHQNIKKT